MTPATGSRALRKVNIRKSHPFLYLVAMGGAVFITMMGYNYWTKVPTFNPYGWSRYIVGTVFLVVGVAQLVILNVFRDLRALRLAWLAGFITLGVWAVANTQQTINGNASWALPFSLGFAAFVEGALLIEAAINPMTQRK